MFQFSFDWMQTLSMLWRVTLAAVLAGFIGYEREHVQRNAGMRTHILVAIGAALVMCSGEFLMSQYPNSNIDPRPHRRSGGQRHRFSLRGGLSSKRVSPCAG